MLFNSAAGLVRVLVMSILAYAALVIVLRLAGKRALSKLNAFDYVVTVALGSSFATIILTKDVALAEGVLAFAMLAFLQWTVSRLSIASPRFKRAVRSQPTLLVRDGQYRHANLRSERVTTAEVNEAVRNAGVGRLDQVAAVVLETDGSMSVIAKGEKEPTLLADVDE